MTNWNDMDMESSSVASNEVKDIVASNVEATASSDNCDANDPYGYLSRGDYTSEAFKLEIMNLPKHFGIAQLKKKLLSCGLKPCKIKTVDRGHYAFVTFSNEIERDKAISVLQGLVWKNKPIKVKKAQPTGDPLILKRKLELDAMKSEEKCVKSVLENAAIQDSELVSVDPVDRLNNTVTSLWRTPYEEQLKMKQADVVKFIKNLDREIEKSNMNQKDWLKSQRCTYGGLCCNLENIKPSPVIDSYRNKCEFTIGMSCDGIDNVVGFRIGSYRSGEVGVLEPTECVHIPAVMKEVAKKLQFYLQTFTKRASFNAVTRQGHWRTAAVRSSRCGQVMLNVVIHPQLLTEGELETEKKSLKQYFISTSIGSPASLSVLFSVASDRHNEGLSTCEVLLGEKFIEEDLMQMKFQISPSAFFQVNTPAAEILYSSIADMCHCSSNTVVLDICCGTGTIGLTVARSVKTVIGIDICSEAIEDAKKNAVVNNILNADFIAGRVEDVLQSVLWRVAGQDIVLVVDPPRAGLHSDVVRLIRRSPSLKRLIYVSCKPSGAKQNIIDFTREASKRVTGSPFRLMKVVPVDLFPHTEHCEIILLLERTT